jgi:hypothetical protein
MKTVLAFGVVLLAYAPSFAQDLSNADYQDLLQRVIQVPEHATPQQLEWLRVACSVVEKREKETRERAVATGGSYVQPIAVAKCRSTN